MLDPDSSDDLDKYNEVSMKGKGAFCPVYVGVTIKVGLAG